MSLAAAAKKVLTVPVLLKQFQAKVKEAGLPPHLDAAMTDAGATYEEWADAKGRNKPMVDGSCWTREILGAPP